MAAGLPLITTNTGGIPEICKNAVHVIDKKEINNLLYLQILSLYKDSPTLNKLDKIEIFDKNVYAHSFLNSIK